MAPVNKLLYYEDIYGSQDPDEEIESFPDQCEDDTSSDEDDTHPATTSTKNSFFSPFTTPKTPAQLARAKETGKSKMPSSIDKNIFKDLSNLSGISGPGQGYPSLIDFKRGSASTTGNQLTPRKYGMFSSSPCPLPTVVVDNTAGQAMDDLLETGDPDDVFHTLYEELADHYETPAMHESVDGFQMEPNLDTVFAHTEDEAKKIERANSIVSISEGAADADVEKFSVEATGNVEDIENIENSNEATSTVSGRKARSSQHPISIVNRYSTRNQEKLKKAKQAAEKAAKKQPTRFSSRINHNNAKQTRAEPSGCNRLTARAAVLQAKLKRRASNLSFTTSKLHGRCKATEILRDWKEGAGLVVVMSDEVDVDLYERMELK